MEGSLGGHHAGELHQEAARAKAERIIAEELQRHGWQEQDLVSRRKNDPTKLEIAARLRRETTLSLKAIAARVHLGSSKTANAKLQQQHMRGAPATDALQARLGIKSMTVNQAKRTGPVYHPQPIGGLAQSGRSQIG